MDKCNYNSRCGHDYGHGKVNIGDSAPLDRSTSVRDIMGDQLVDRLSGVDCSIITSL